MTGWRLRKELMLQFKSKGSLLVEFSLLQGRLVFFLRPSTDWMRSTHIMEGNVLYSKSTNLKVNVTLKIYIPSQHYPDMFDQISGYRGQSKLTHKFKHHKCFDQGGICFFHDASNSECHQDPPPSVFLLSYALSWDFCPHGYEVAAPSLAITGRREREKSNG